MMRAAAVVALLAVSLAGGCRRSSAPDEIGHQREVGASSEPRPWSVTAWGEKYEVFPETKPLIAGRAAASHTHVTVLADFSPLRQGEVEAVLRSGVAEQRFAGTFRRDGIFEIIIRPGAEGEYDLAFRIESKHGAEEIPAGRVRVGSPSSPGGLVEGPPPPGGTVHEGAAGEAISFLKEQQWKTPFSTTWSTAAPMQGMVSGPARVRAAAGGEVVLTAPVDAVLATAPWPHRGQAVRQGAALFRLLPSVDASRSLAELHGDVGALEAELRAARDREQRLSGLLESGGASRAEVERARASREALEARAGAARRDAQAAAAARSGRPSGPLQTLRAPWPGIVADVQVSPGQAVAAGAVLGRLVKTRPVWLEVALRPEDARRATSMQQLFVRPGADAEPIGIPVGAARMVARAPEVDARTGTVAVTFEVDQSAFDLPIGSAVEAQVLLPRSGEGVVVPGSALVDDGGVPVVYVQIEGERFERRPVKVVGRLGDRAAVEGLQPGERVVTVGGASIRRASLLSAGAPEGHVH